MSGRSTGSKGMVALILSDEKWRNGIEAVLSVLLAIVPALSLPGAKSALSGEGGVLDWLSLVLGVAFLILYIYVFATSRSIEAGQRVEAQSAERALRNKVDDANKSLNREMRRNRILESSSSGVDSLLSTSAQNANIAIHDIEDKGFLVVSKHQFCDNCTWACARIHGALSANYKGSRFEVSYVQRDETIPANADPVIRTTAFENGGHRAPATFNKKRTSDDARWRYDYQLFVDESSDISVLLKQIA